MSEDILARKVNYRKRLLLEQGPLTIVAPIENVCYISADTGGTKVFLMDRTAGYVGESLTQLMEELDPAMFVRANRQYIVALDAINAFEDTCPFGAIEGAFSKCQTGHTTRWKGHF